MNETVTISTEDVEETVELTFGEKCKRFLTHPMTIQVGLSTLFVGACWGIAALLEKKEDENSENETDEIHELEN